MARELARIGAQSLKSTRSAKCPASDAPELPGGTRARICTITKSASGGSFASASSGSHVSGLPSLVSWPA